MSMNDLSPDQLRLPEKKQPYEKPSFRCEQVFVTTALSCGKISATQSGCGINTKAS